MRTSLQGHL